LAILFLFFILIANAIFLKFNAFRIFNLLDMGSYMDAGWRILCGQRPYVDFIFHEGPVHIYMHAFFFQLFGFGKAAILAHLIVVHSIVISLVFFTLYRRTPIWATLAATLLTVPSFFWPISHPWHDQSAFLWGTSALCLLLWQTPYRNSKHAFLTSMIVGMLVATSFLTKINIGFAFGLAFVFIVLSTGYPKAGIGGYVLGGILGLLIILFLARAPVGFIEQLLLQAKASKVHGRLSNLLVFQDWFLNYYWVALILVLLDVVANPKRKKIFLVVFLGMTFVGLFALLTGGMRRTENIVFWGIQMMSAFLCMYDKSIVFKKIWQKKFHQSLIGILYLLVIFLTVLSVLKGLELSVWYRAAGKDDANYYALKSEPLSGWRFHPWDGVPLDFFVKFIKENVPEEDSILNLADMYIIYALTQRDSYRGLPVIIWKDHIPVPGKQTEKVKKAFLSNPPDWIIIHPNSFQNEIVALDLVDVINTQYVPVYTMGNYHLFRKK